MNLLSKASHNLGRCPYGFEGAQFPLASAKGIYSGPYAVMVVGRLLATSRTFSNVAAQAVLLPA